MPLIDFTNCEPYYKGYDGADGKLPVIYEGSVYMLKFPGKKPAGSNDELRASYSNNIYSEFIGCHIFESVGIPAQETLLGNFGAKEVVACKDFIEGLSPDLQLQEFNKLENSYLDSEALGSARAPTLENITAIFNMHERLSRIRTAAIERYWDTFIVDAALGNFDRHSGNWGYLIDKNTGEASLAPVYDCGSCLYPQLAEEELQNILKDNEAIHTRIIKFPLAALKIDGKKVNYRDYICSLQNEDCNRALERIYPRMDMSKIREIVENTPGISDNRKEFYAVMLEKRIETILTSAYERMKDKEIESAKVSLICSQERDIRGEAKAAGDVKSKDSDMEM